MYKIIALIGESGSGKDTLLKHILAEAPDLHEIIPCTTRPKREGEIDGVNYFFTTPEAFGEKVLHYEMLECTVFNDWFYGTSFDSVRSDCVNIGVFNPTGVEALMERPDVEIKVFKICADAKTRLLRQLNREDNPDVDEIVRRYTADKLDFMDLDFPYIDIYNNTPLTLISSVWVVLNEVKDWRELGQK